MAGGGSLCRSFATFLDRTEDVLTARAATGISAEGDLTVETTWYEGFGWRIARCSRCGNQLGWSYEAKKRWTTPRWFHLLWFSRLNQTNRPALKPHPNLYSTFASPAFRALSCTIALSCDCITCLLW